MIEGILNINTRFPIKLVEKLRELAKTHQRSLNGEIIWALWEYVRLQRQQKPK